MQFNLMPFTKGSKYVISGYVECDKNQLLLQYVVDGPMNELILSPPVGRLRRQKNLWQKTCFELFCINKSGKGYVEYNFSPFKAFSADQFNKYRDFAVPDVITKQVLIKNHVATTKMVCRVKVVTSREIAKVFKGFNPCVILETENGIEYWALNHNSKRPDFHSFSESLNLT